MSWFSNDYVFTRFIFQRALALIYLFGFLIAANQFRGLCGSHGLLPVRLYVERVSFWDDPSLFWFFHPDWFLSVMAWLGVGLALIAAIGVSDLFSTWLSAALWFSLWAIYLSFANVGQTFYGFGWEMLLLETGFLAIFLGPAGAPVPLPVIWMLRWVLFRVMFGAGLIKLRGDECWRDLTCLSYHYETQPMPGPLSWYFHHQPLWAQKGGVLFNHFVELIVPFGYFLFAPVRTAAGLITILFQFTLVLSGNLSWLNCLTMVLCLACFDDRFWLRLFGGWTLPVLGAAAGWPAPVIYLLTAIVVLMSLQPTLNLLSAGQIMNTSFNPLHLVNTYGAFGSVTRQRYELVIEGSNDALGWREYEFKGKPGDVNRAPPQVTPYHFKLDWQMWFAAMMPYSRSPWLINLLGKILVGQSEVLDLLRVNPFPDHPPKFVRVRKYLYHFTDFGDSAWWRREGGEEFLPSLSLDNSAFVETLKANGWMEE